MDAFPNTIYPGFPIAMFDDQTRVSHVFKQTINSHGFTVFHFQWVARVGPAASEPFWHSQGLFPVSE